MSEVCLNIPKSQPTHTTKRRHSHAIGAVKARLSSLSHIPHEHCQQHCRHLLSTRQPHHRHCKLTPSQTWTCTVQQICNLGRFNHCRTFADHRRDQQQRRLRKSVQAHNLSTLNITDKSCLRSSTITAPLATPTKQHRSNAKCYRSVRTFQTASQHIQRDFMTRMQSAPTKNDSAVASHIPHGRCQQHCRHLLSTRRPHHRHCKLKPNCGLTVLSISAEFGAFVCVRGVNLLKLFQDYSFEVLYLYLSLSPSPSLCHYLYLNAIATFISMSISVSVSLTISTSISTCRARDHKCHS